MKILTEIVSTLKKKIDEAIDKFLDMLPSFDYDGPKITLEELFIKLMASQEVYGQLIIDDHQHFKKQSLGHFNTLLHNPLFGSQYVLQEIKATFN